MLQVLTRRHQKVRRLRRLVTQSRARHAERVFVLEGTKLVSEALAAGVALEGLYLASGADDPTVAAALAAGVRVHELAPGVMEAVADTVSPQPVLAVAAALDAPLEALQGAELVMVCVDVRDPGNLGTILRSAQAAGFGGVVCCDGSVDVYNPKTVRSSSGALFYLPVVAGGNPVEVLEHMGSWGWQRLGAAPHGGLDYTAADLTQPTAFVMGNEAGGLTTGLDSVLDGLVTIPMAGRAESLNVAMAAAVLCFEAARQRRAAFTQVMA